MSTIYPPEYQQSPPQPPPLPPHRSWPRRHKILTAFGSGFGLLVVLIIVITATSTPSITKPSTPATAAAAPPTSAQATPTPTPSPTPSLSGPVGTVYQVTDSSGNVITVTLTKVIDPAQGADQFTTPNNGYRFVGAVFTLKGVSGTFSDDANSDATLVGSNGQSYTADFNSIAGVTNFNNGLYNLTPGAHSVGAVTFQVPTGVSVSAIQWSGSGGFGGAPATWTLP
jgi:hypothetical protein